MYSRFMQSLLCFTYTDWKTIIAPVSVFALIVAPMSSILNGVIAVLWIWLHLLYCNVSNQCNSVDEDGINHPWRPIPAGLISQAHALILRWALILPCLCFSSIFGLPTILASVSLVMTSILYDDFKLSGHWAAKNVCTLCGYLCFEVGAVIIMGSSHNLDAIALKALGSSSLVILSTIHVQDFPDIEGDTALDRKTIPIISPVMSRPTTSIMIVLWSIYSAFIWSMGIWCSAILLSVGFVVAGRLYILRSTSEDMTTYVAYNVWLSMLHLLPANVRWGTFSL